MSADAPWDMDARLALRQAMDRFAAGHARLLDELKASAGLPVGEIRGRMYRAPGMLVLVHASHADVDWGTLCALSMSFDVTVLRCHLYGGRIVCSGMRRHASASTRHDAEALEDHMSYGVTPRVVMQRVAAIGAAAAWYGRRCDGVRRGRETLLRQHERCLSQLQRQAGEHRLQEAPL